jgi:hypothetical protein
VVYSRGRKYRGTGTSCEVKRPWENFVPKKVPKITQFTKTIRNKPVTKIPTLLRSLVVGFL